MQFVRRRPKTFLVVVELHEVGPVGGRGRTRKSTQPGASGVIELTPFEFLDRLATLIPLPSNPNANSLGTLSGRW